MVSFSALQRAENSSIGVVTAVPKNSNTFQCSSASRKFLNRVRPALNQSQPAGFSALQRAENSSIR